MDPKTTINIGLSLALLLIVGMTLTWLSMRGGLPFSNELADDAEIAELAEQGAQLSLQLQDQLTEQLENTPAHENQKRLDSPMGQALLRQCLEWTEFYDNHSGADALQNREEACSAYADYVAEGKKPE